MTSEERSRDWLFDTLEVRPAKMAKLAQLAERVIAGNREQNLISKTTEDDIWWRHIVDSAQLLTGLPLAPSKRERRWIDLGSGAGFPGLVIAIITGDPIILSEMRPARAAFLEDCATALSLDNVTIFGGKAETMEDCADIITARAFAPLEKLVKKSRHLAGRKTIWLLPKGKNAVNELANLPKPWQDAFHVKQSVTSPESAILIGKGRFSGG